MRIKLYLIFIFVSSVFLSGCVGTIISGANMVYDRHNLYKKMSDMQIAALVNKSLFQDKVFRRPDCNIDIAVFNGDILLAGNVPSERLRNLANKRVVHAAEHRRFFMQLSLKPTQISDVEDGWITMKIRSQIFSDSAINPNKFKVVTVNGIVYLMGDVIPEQARRVIHYAKNTSGVLRVVKLFKYYNLSDKPKGT